MSALFGFISLEAVKGAVVSLLQQLGKIILTVLAFFAILAILYPLLPADPFRDSILQMAAQVKEFAAWINYFVDVKMLVATFFFYACWRYAYWVYRHVGGIIMDKSGQLEFDA